MALHLVERHFFHSHEVAIHHEGVAHVERVDDEQEENGLQLLAHGGSEDEGEAQHARADGDPHVVQRYLQGGQ